MKSALFIGALLALCSVVRADDPVRVRQQDDHFGLMRNLASNRNIQGGVGGQGGIGGGGMGGGRSGSGSIDGSAAAIEENIAKYLNGESHKNILTPGEYTEYDLNLKKDQVIFAEASSDAFDPALQITDPKGTVIADNDDRYPGDQRPLLMWRTPQDGPYQLRVRCFHDKSGGQFSIRYNILDSVLVDSSRHDPYTLGSGVYTLFRLPLKAGDIKEIVFDGLGQSISPSITTFIAPNGLPNKGLERPFEPALRHGLDNPIIAPVDGDYYALVFSGYQIKVVPTAQDLTPQPIKIGDSATDPRRGWPAIWSLTVKKGQVIEASTPDLSPQQTQVIFSEAPDFASFASKDKDYSPFYPTTKPAPEAALTPLDARDRDGRYKVAIANRDATIWVATNGYGEGNQPFTMNIKPGATPLGDGQEDHGRLPLGGTTYRIFDAQIGDVVSLTAKASNFYSDITLYGPNHDNVDHNLAEPDQNETQIQHIVRTPGQYLVALTCPGYGGGGDYSLLRKVIPAKSFDLQTPATGTVQPGETHVWKFEAKPNQPLLIKWKSDDWGGYIQVVDSAGEDMNLTWVQIDPQTRYAFVTVDKPKTVLLVLSPGTKRKYSFELNPLPGYQPTNH